MKSFSCLSLILLSLFSFTPALATNLNSDPDCPSEYFYRGYDYVKGNPISDGGDPGWKEQFIKNVEGGTSCMAYPAMGGYSHSAFLNEVDYKKRLDKMVNTEAYLEEPFLLTAVAFTGSDEFEYQRRNVFNRGLVTVHSTASSTHFIGGLSIYDNYTFTTPFQQAIETFPISTEDPNWFKHVSTFFSQYGTHVIGNRVNLGAIWVYETQFTKEDYMWLLTTGDFYIGLSALAEYSRSNGASIIYESARDTTAREMVASYVKTQRSHAIGTPPTTDADFNDFLNTWYDITKPIPTSMEMNPISELLTSRLFPNDAHIDAKRAVMEAGYALYCESVPYCHEPQENN